MLLLGSSLRPYLSCIAAQHLLLGLRDPTTDHLLQLERRGFVSVDARRRTCAPLRSSSYPAVFALYFLEAALHLLASRERVRFWSAVSSVGFLINAPPSSISSTSTDCVRLSQEAIFLELRILKYGTTVFAPCVAIRTPVSGFGVPLYRFFSRLCIFMRNEPVAPWFSSRGLPQATSVGFATTDVLPPTGTSFTPLSA